MYCMHCGKELPEEAKFCFHCGQPVPPAEEKPETGAAKLGKWIVAGIAVVGVIILVAVIGGIKNYNQRNADPTPEPEQGIEVFEAEDLPEPPQEEPAPEAEPEPQEVEVDPNSAIIPDFADFFLKEKTFDKDNGDVGHKYELKGFPIESKEAVVEEMLSVLAEPQYQLEPDWEDSYYYQDEGTSSDYYYFTYTGANPGITEVYIDEANDPYTFKISVWDLWANDGIFNLGIYFNQNFEEVTPGKHTQQDVGEQIEYAGNPQPQNETVDPDSVLLPNLADFLLSDKDFNQAYSSGGRRYEVGPMPDAAYEDVVAEVKALLEEPRYQLELEGVDSNYYDDGSGEAHNYFYRYIGTNPNIFYVDHEWKDVSFQVMLTIYDNNYNDGYFSIGLFYCENFEEEISGKYTTRRTDKDSDGGLRGADEFPQKQTGSSSGGVPDVSGTYDHTPPASKLKCLTCNGDGDCNTCGGSGYKRIGGAKAGCTTCRGNGKCRTCKGSGTR